jgi:hypothetical protein
MAKKNNPHLRILTSTKEIIIVNNSNLTPSTRHTVYTVFGHNWNVVEFVN